MDYLPSLYNVFSMVWSFSFSDWHVWYLIEMRWFILSPRVIFTLGMCDYWLKRDKFYSPPAQFLHWKSVISDWSEMTFTLCVCDFYTGHVWFLIEMRWFSHCSCVIELISLHSYTIQLTVLRVILLSKSCTMAWIAPWTPAKHIAD